MRKAKGTVADGRPAYGGKGECGPCRHPDSKYTRSPESKAKHDKYTKTYTRKKYGLTDLQYVALLKAQNNKCATCLVDADTLSKDLYVDHDHSCCSGRESCGECVRGLLCARCNFALGHVSDRIEVLTSMIKYLNNHKGTNGPVTRRQDFSHLHYDQEQLDQARSD